VVRSPDNVEHLCSKNIAALETVVDIPISLPAGDLADALSYYIAQMPLEGRTYFTNYEAEYWAEGCTDGRRWRDVRFADDKVLKPLKVRHFSGVLLLLALFGIFGWFHLEKTDVYESMSVSSIKVKVALRGRHDAMTRRFTRKRTRYGASQSTTKGEGTTGQIKDSDQVGSHGIHRRGFPRTARIRPVHHRLEDMEELLHKLISQKSEQAVVAEVRTPLSSVPGTDSLGGAGDDRTGPVHQRLGDMEALLHKLVVQISGREVVASGTGAQ
jgi:hypothetical protein